MAIGTGAAILGSAVIGGVGSLLAGKSQASAAQSAAQTQAASADRAAGVQLQMYNQSRADMAPWRNQGQMALNALQKIMIAGPGKFKASPGYQWTLDQGLQGAQRAASAGGANRSGAHMKAATEYAEGLASTEYDNFLNRYYKSLTPYQALAGIGQSAAATQSSNAMGTGNALAGIYQNQGQALAAGQLGAGQAQAAGMMGMGNTAANFGSWYGQNQFQQQLLNNMFPQSYIQPKMGSTNQLAAWNPNTTGAYYNW